MGKSTQELKYKRLKVGHACYICRSKKIKCDGLRPCMQCKARGRNCQSSSNPSSEKNSSQFTPQSTLSSGDEQEDSSNSSNLESDDDSILFSRAKKQDEEHLKFPKYNESWTSNTIHTASENLRQDGPDADFSFSNCPAFGSFVRWREEPPLPTKYTYPIEMPSSEIQMHLIDLYFKSRYKITPMIPKRLFYEQLRIKGPIITPFLLNAMYCVVSNYSTLPDIPGPSVFYNRAKKLLDDFLDTPRVSTVAALCLLSLYEPLPDKSKGVTDQHCRSWMFSGMAFRMCLELGLNVDSPSSRTDMGPEGIEFCRRVFWSCYLLDKMQSAEWERLWAIPSSLVKTGFPQVIPGDDEEEQYIVKVYEQKIRLALISEEGLQIRASFSIRSDISDTKFHNQLLYHRHRILEWRDSLESPELWGLAPCHSVEQALNEPKQSSLISYLHVVFYFMLTETLFYLPNGQHGGVGGGDDSLEQRIYASQLTKSVEILCDNPSMVIRYEFLAHVTITAIRVHARYLNDPDAVIARQSHEFFDRCVRILRKFQKYAIIPECSAVLTHLPLICKKASESAKIDRYQQQQQQQAGSGNISQNPPNFTQVPSHQPYVTALPQPQQEIFDNNSEPFSDNSPLVSSASGYQPIDHINMVTPYNNLVAFGSSFGVDFADRRQLWEHALQDVNNYPQNELGSSANSPVDSTASLSQTLAQQQLGYHESWNTANHSPVASEFTWPSPPYRPLSYNNNNNAPPPQQPQPNYSQPIQTQWTISPANSSPPSPQKYFQQQQQQQQQFPSDTMMSYAPTNNQQQQHHSFMIEQHQPTDRKSVV